MNKLLLAPVAIAGGLLLASLVLVGALIATSGDDEPDSAGAGTAAAVAGSEPVYLGVSFAADRAFITNGELRVASVDAGSPADRAGIDPGDVIRSVDGLVVKTESELRAALVTKQPGDNVRLTYERGDRELRGEVKLARAPAAASGSSPTPAAGAGRSATPVPGAAATKPANQDRLGIELMPISADLKRRYDLKVDKGGQVVTRVELLSPAALGGIREGDVLVAIDGKQLPDDNGADSQKALAGIFQAIPEGRAVDYKLKRGSAEVIVSIRLQSRGDAPRLRGLPSPLRDALESLVDIGALSPSELRALVGAGDHVRIGRVKQASDTSLTVTTTSTKQDLTTSISADTVIQRGVNSIKASELRPDELVIVVSLNKSKAASAVIALGD
jgi:hypothetical protein